MTLIYHITCFDNLATIVEKGGLHCYNQLTQENLKYVNIAHSNIQDRRAKIDISCEPYGNLHDYVPFYFAPRSPMLYSISKGNVEGYEQSQAEIVYLVSSIETVQTHNIRFIFSDGHGIMTITQFYNDINKLNEVDWDIMEAKYWSNTFDDPDRTRRRNAEFLVHEFFPWKCVQQIAVLDKKMQYKVNTLLQDYIFAPPVKVRPNWYY